MIIRNWATLHSLELRTFNKSRRGTTNRIWNMDSGNEISTESNICPKEITFKVNLRKLQHEINFNHRITTKLIRFI